MKNYDDDALRFIKDVRIEIQDIKDETDMYIIDNAETLSIKHKKQLSNLYKELSKFEKHILHYFIMD